MIYFLRFSSLFAVSLVFLFLQSTEIFKIGLVNPNFLLVICASLLIFYERRQYFYLASLIYLALLIYSVLFLPFWLVSVIVIIFFSLLLGFIDLRLTGTKILDIGLSVIVLTLLFYITLWVIGVQSFGFFVLGEMLYNILVAAILYPVIKSLVLNTK